MRLGIVTHRFVYGDGQGRVNMEIARTALERGHQVRLIGSEIAEEFRAHPAASAVLVPVSGPTELLRNQIFARRSAQRIREVRQDLDALQVNGFITWAPGDVNTAHFVHGDWLRSPVHVVRLRRDPYGLYQWIYTALNARLEKRAYRQAKAVVAVSERVRRQLIGIGVPADRIRVILNGVDVEAFRPGPEERAALGLPTEVPLALFVGDIRTPRKNLDTVLRALARVPCLHLGVVGTTEGSPYPPMAAALGLAGRVHFLGFRRDVPQLMRAADMFVFPSRYEACSLVLLEALASGLPVVTADTAGGAEVITDACGVVLPDPDDVGALVSALTALQHDPTRRAEMSQAARSLAEQYTWARMGETYLQLYEEIAGWCAP